MAFGNKYTLTFADAQNREHIAYLDLEGYAAGVTALVPGENPLIWSAGASRGDVFATLMPSSVEMSLIVEDSALFSDIAGDAEFAWRLRWTIAGTEVWRGHVLTDELTQPLDIPGQLTVRAVCGLVTLENIEWTPASAARQTMMPLVADALGDLSHGLSIRSLANWHAGSTPGTPPSTSTAVSGNSYARYEILPTNYRNSDGTTYASSAMVLSNLAGLFLSTLVQADGKWTLVQREAITGASYTTNVYDSAGAYSTTEAVSRLQIDTATQVLLYGGQLSAARAYSGAETRYSHGDLGFQVFDNSSFQTWSGSPSVPTSWTEIDERAATAGALTKVETGFHMAVEAPSGKEFKDEIYYGVRIAGITAYGGSGEPRDYAKIGLIQNGQVATASGATIEIGFSVKVGSYDSGSRAPRPIYWSLWLDTGATDYYWSNQSQAWTAGTVPTHTSGGALETVAIAAKNRTNVPVDPGFKSFLFVTGATPGTGTLRLVLYNAVGLFSGDGSLTATYDEVSVKISGDSDYSNGTARTTVTDAATTGRAIYDTGTYLAGQGPTTSHKRAITFSSGTAAQNWKPAGYSNGETLSGETLERVRCERALVALGTPPKRLRAGFEMLSGTYWPHNGLLLDSVEYTCTSVSHSARFCQYEGEWVEQRAHSYTPTEETTTILAWVDPGMNDLYEDAGEGYGPEEPPYIPPDPGGNPKDWTNTNNPVADARAASFGASLAQSLTIGPNPNPTERLVISSDADDTAIRFDTTVGGTGVYIVGIDTSDSNSFKITEGLTLGVTPTSGVGDRLKIDANGNFTTNPGTKATSNTFTIDGQNFTTTGYGNSGSLALKAHYWTGVADASATAGLLYAFDAADANQSTLTLSASDISIGIRSTASGSAAKWVFLDDTSQPTDADSPPLLFLGRNGAGAERWGTIHYDKIATDGWSLKAIAYTDAGSTAGTTFEVLSAGGIKWDKRASYAGIAAPGGTAEYHTRYADTEELPKGYVGTSGPIGIPITWATLYVGAAITSSTTTYLFDSGTKKGTHTMPTSHFVAGQTYEVFASGAQSAGGTGGTCQWAVRVGTTVIAQTSAISIDGTADWVLSGTIVVSAVSAGNATLEFDGVFTRGGTATHLTGSVGSIAVASAHDLDVSLVTATLDTHSISYNMATLKQVY